MTEATSPVTHKPTALEKSDMEKHPQHTPPLHHTMRMDTGGPDTLAEAEHWDRDIPVPNSWCCTGGHGWEEVTGSVHCHHTEEVSHNHHGARAGKSEESRDGEDNTGSFNLLTILPSTPHQHLQREGPSWRHRRDNLLYPRRVFIISGNFTTKEFPPAPSLTWLFLCFLREIRACLTFLSGA